MTLPGSKTVPRYKHIVTEAEQGKRLDAVPAELEGIPSRSFAVRLIEQGDVLLNEKPTTKKHIAVAGDLIYYMRIYQGIEKRKTLLKSGKNFYLD